MKGEVLFMNTSKKIISVILSVLLTLSTAFFAFAENVKIGENTQTHVVADFKESNALLKNDYFDGLITPLDGTAGQPDMVIPGLSEKDDMIPQGLAYYPEKNQVLISAYMGSNESHSNKTTVIYVLDFNTGKYIAKIDLYTADGKPFTAHSGGIAVSKNNLYICATDSKIAYIPLSHLKTISEGESKELIIAGVCDIGKINNNTNTSYISYEDGILWTGNFYHPELQKYGRRASEKYGSLITGYKTGDKMTSEDEWNYLSAVAESGIPDYVLTISEDIYDIQSVVIKYGTVFIGTSYGRKKDSNFLIGKVNLNGKNSEELELSNGIAVNACPIEISNTYKHLPMTEGMFWKYDSSGHGRIYNIFESAAYYYYGFEPENTSVSPTDVVWSIDLDSFVKKPVENCTCNCHKSGFMGFIWKITNFFNRIFKLNPVCRCGEEHY